MDVDEALGWLQWNSLFIDKDTSAEINIKCLHTICDNCVESTIRVINSIIESHLKKFVLETRIGLIDLTVRDPKVLSINLCYGLPFLRLKDIRDKELLIKLFANVVKCIDPYDAFSWNLFKVLNFLSTLIDDIPMQYALELIFIAEYMLKVATNRYHKYIEATIKASIKLLSYPLVSQLFEIYCLKIVASENLCCYTLAELIGRIEKDLLVCKKIEAFFKFIRIGLHSNIESFQMAVLYQSLINRIEYSEWEINAKKHLKGSNTSLKSDTYGQSFCNHIIPLTLKRFPNSYKVICELEPKLTAYTFLTMQRRNMLKFDEILPKTLQFVLNYDDNISLIGLEVLLTFKSKNIELTHIHYNQIKCFLIQRVITLDDIKQICKLLKLFHSHIIVTTNAKLLLTKEADMKEVEDYFKFLYKFCLMYCKELNAMKNEFAYKILYDLCELFLEDSNKLKTQYNLAKTDNYEKQQNPLLLSMISKKSWKLTNQTTLEILLKTYYNNGYTGNVFENLIIDFYISDERLQSSIHSKCLEYLNTSNMLFTSKAASLHAIYITHKIAVGKDVKADVDFIIRTFSERVGRICRSDATVANFLDSPVLALVRTMAKTFKEEKVCVFVDFEELFDLFYKLFDYYLENDGEIGLFKGNTAGKAVEATLIEGNTLLLKCLPRFNTTEATKMFFANCTKIIQNSSMRRPITTIANNISQLCTQLIVRNQKDTLIIFEALEESLRAVSEAENKASVIRRNAEARLLIHSICVADELPGKPLLQRAIKFMMEVVEMGSSEASIAAALNCLQSLISDNTIKESISEYIDDIAVRSLEVFTEESWKIRNAAIQVWESLLLRILGQPAHINKTRKSAEEVILSHPKLVSYFYEKLCSDLVTKNENTILILTLFSETPRRRGFYHPEVSKIADSLAELFLQMIATADQKMKAACVRSYVAFTHQTEIPIAISNLVGSIIEDFEDLDKNTLFAYLKSIELLYRKYATYKEKSELFELQMLVAKLGEFLHEKTKLLDLHLPFICFKTENTESSIIKVNTALKAIDFESRLECRTNMLYVLTNVSFSEFVDFLESCLNAELTIPLRIQCLVCAAIKAENCTNHELSRILSVIVKNFALQENLCGYLVDHYVDVIFYLISLVSVDESFKNILPSIPLNKQPLSLAEKSVYVSILQCGKHVDEKYNIFIRTILNDYIKALLHEDENVEHLICALPFLYKRWDYNYDLLIITVLLLLNNETRDEGCELTGQFLNSRVENHFMSLTKLLNLDTLMTYLKYSKLVLRFLILIFIHVANLPDDYEDDQERFYLTENNIVTIPKTIIFNMLLYSLRKLCKSQIDQNK